MIRRLAALLVALALVPGPAAAAPASGSEASTAPLLAALAPPVSTTTSPYLGGQLVWTTFGQLTGDGSAGPDGSARLNGVAGGAGLLVETGADTTEGRAAAWTSTDGGASWTEHVQPDGPASFGRVVAHAGTYVTSASDGLYSSTDGAVWARAATGPHAIRQILVAGGSSGFIAFVRNGTSTITRVWRSSTGTTWTADPVQAVVSTFCPQSIVVTSSRVVASGADCAKASQPRILVNASGRTWVRGTPPLGLRTLGTHTRGTSVSYVASRYVLTGGNLAESATWVWSSTNGLAWRRIASMPRTAGWSIDHITRIVRLSPGWLAIGDRDMPADDGVIVAWASADLVHWSRSVPRLGSACRATVQMVGQATVAGGRLLAVGNAWNMVESCGETWMAVVSP